MGAEQFKAEGWDREWMLYLPQLRREVACHSQEHTLLWLWMDQMLSEENCNPWGGGGGFPCHPRECDTPEAAGTLLQVPRGIQALLRQGEMPIPHGREDTGLCVSHRCSGHGEREEEGTMVGFWTSNPSSASPVPRGRCERGYTGARCERVDIFYLRGDRGQIVIISLIAAIVTLIILIVCACLCSHHCRKQRRKRKADEMETLNKNLPSKSEDVLETGIV
uniref:Uncharacterized protein n=1 Tax=Melopsittacus undulatus TaxID=13146 RepID=A0A8V5G7G7_MELUD